MIFKKCIGIFIYLYIIKVKKKRKESNIFGARSIIFNFRYHRQLFGASAICTA